MSVVALICAGLSATAVGSSTAVGGPPSAPPQICGNSGVLDGGPTTAPPGAIEVPKGNNKDVDFRQENKTFWFAPGVHTLDSGEYDKIEPGAKSTYIGAPGAVLDGQHLNSYAFGGSSAGVRIADLEIRNFGKAGENKNAGVVNHDSGDGWVMESLYIHDNAGAGVFLGSDNVVRNSCLKDNGQYGFSMYKDPVPGKSSITNITLDHNEIAGNNTDDWEARDTTCGCTGGGKFWDVQGARVTNNYVHHNRSVGLWADTNDIDFLFDGNWIEGNDAQAIFYEISYNAAIRNNVIKGNNIKGGKARMAQADSFPETAVYISESGGDSRVSSTSTGTPTVDISNNLFIDNWGGVALWENADRFCNSPANTSTGYCTAVNPAVTLAKCAAGTIDNEPYRSDCRWKTQNVSISNNEFRFDPAQVGGCDIAYCGHMAVLSNYGSDPKWSPYQGNVIEKAITFNQNNKWRGNKYIGPWQFITEDQGSLKDWATWQAAPYNQDAGSTKQ